MIERRRDIGDALYRAVDPSAWCRTHRTMRTGDSEDRVIGSARRLTIVHDIEGPIVTGVLGGD